MSKKIIHGIIIGIASSCVALSLQFTGLLGWLEGPLWDMRVRIMCRPSPAADQIRIILLDQTSLDWGESEMKWAWPWPRIVYEPIINFCKRAGAKAIIFDVLFTEPSERIEEDEILGTAIGGVTGFVATVFLSNEQGSDKAWPVGLDAKTPEAKGLAQYLAGMRGTELVMPRAAFPISEVADNCDMLGNVYAVSDADATIRRIAPFCVFDGRVVPILGLAGYVAHDPLAEIQMENNILHVGDRDIPLDEHGKTILRFRRRPEGQDNNKVYEQVNAAAVIQSELRLMEGGQPACDPEFFRDTYVFLGFSAPGLVDLKSTPVNRRQPGVEIHATVLDNLLSNDFIRDTGTMMTIICAVLFALASGIIGRACVNSKQVVWTFIGMLLLPVLLGLAAYFWGYWLQMAVLNVAVAIALVSAVIVNYSVEGKKKRFIKNAFKQYLSPAVIDKLLHDPGRLKLGGESRELSILFSDLQGFTGISEGLNPQELTALLNDYLTAMTDIILDEGGTVDKYEGDAIIAFWNAPLDVNDHAECAVRAGLRCGRKLAELRPSFRERVGKDLFMRVGVNTGLVVVGNMGSHQRFDYTFLGDAGNLASRLEGINKQFGTYMMISENTRERMGDKLKTRELSKVRVVGRKEPVKVFEPMFEDDLLARDEIFKTFAEALQMYYKGEFGLALDLFATIADSDAPAAAYVRKCRNLIENPPGIWDGVWVMTEK